MKKLLTLLTVLCCLTPVAAQNPYDNTDTLFVARDGSCEFRNVNDAIEVCRAFMTYHKVIFIKEGIYKEKVIVPSWLTNIELCGESLEKTVITYDDHANIPYPPTGGPMGTFRTATLKVEGNDITLKNLTIENNSGRKGQALALHTEGDRIIVVNCRLLGNQDTVYTGVENTRIYFKDCYIEGTTDFIFGPSTAWFEGCTICSLLNSYVTAASTPEMAEYGYIFNNCKLIAAEGIDHVFLGRPWRPYGYTLFMNCELGSHIVPAGWYNWRNEENEKTARYYEYNNTGEGANTSERVGWSHQLTKKEAESITLEKVFAINNGWNPEAK